jgi:hypothetical protein
MSDLIEQSPATLEDAINELEAAWQRFADAVDRVPAERADETGVCGDWSLKILVGHVGFWDGKEAERLGQPGATGELDWQALNDENEADTATRPYSEIRAELQTHHDRLLEVLRTKPGLDPKRVRELSYDHYIEHAAEVEAWLSCSTS